VWRAEHPPGIGGCVWRAEHPPGIGACALFNGVPCVGEGGQGGGMGVCMCVGGGSHPGDPYCCPARPWCVCVCACLCAATGRTPGGLPAGRASQVPLTAPEPPPPTSWVGPWSQWRTWRQRTKQLQWPSCVELKCSPRVAVGRVPAMVAGLLEQEWGQVPDLVVVAAVVVVPMCWWCGNNLI
jgi:hypothetical protein